MIDNYIKTGMVFYDDMDKQHFRSECCEDTFYHYIDADHFPSFQFVTEMPIPLKVIEIYLYDLDDKLIGTFGDAEFNAVNTVYHGVNGYQYVHNVVDIISYPAGYDNKTGYYIKICFADLPQDIHSTDTNGSPLYTFGYGRFTPIYYYNNKTYNVWMDNGDSRAHIWAYNHITDTESANYDLHSVSEPAGVGDPHPMPSVIVADDGHIVVAQEFIRVAPATHNDAITIKRSDNVEDEASWVNATAENANYYTTIGDSATIRLAYPLLHKDTSGNLYVICRRYTSGGRYNRIFKSTDHGVSWDAGHDIIDSGSDTIWMAPCAILNGTDNTLRYAINRQDTAAGFHDKVFYLESDDGGITWHDISGSFSKDTVASGAITLAELENAAYDFLVVTKTDVGKDNIVPKLGTIDDDGTPYIATQEYDTGGPYDYHMYYWNGAAWSFSTIKDGAANTTPVLIHIGGTVFNCYIEETANQMALYETVNLTTWAKIRDVKTTAGLTSNTFLLDNFTNNYKDADYKMFIGVYGTDAAYSDIFYEVLEDSDPDCWYSEAFKVCDCEPDGVGDGENLITNGWMEDWAGIADPNNYPLGWTLANNDATNYVADSAGECQMISNNTADIFIQQTVLEIGKWYVFTVNITAAVDGRIDFFNLPDLIGVSTSVGIHNFVFQAVGTSIIIAKQGITDITFTDVRVEEFVGFEFCDRMTLNWWSDCDWDSIIYQDGFRNSLVLADPENITLDIPSEDIVVNPEERLGEMFVNDVIIKKRYRFKIRIPEYLWNALIRLPAYGSEMPNFHAWITLPDGSSAPMSEVIVKGEWDTGNCMNTFEVEFVDSEEYPVVATNCCNDEDVSEI